MKVKHPSGSQRENGWRAAPVLVFTKASLDHDAPDDGYVS